MADFGGADRLLAAADAADEVAHVVIRVVEPRGATRQRFLQQFRVTGRDDSTIDEDPLAFLADKEDAVIVPLHPLGAVSTGGLRTAGVRCSLDLRIATD